MTAFTTDLRRPTTRQTGELARRALPRLVLKEQVVAVLRLHVQALAACMCCWSC